MKENISTLPFEKRIGEIIRPDLEKLAKDNYNSGVINGMFIGGFITLGIITIFLHFFFKTIL